MPPRSTIAGALFCLHRRLVPAVLVLIQSDYLESVPLAAPSNTVARRVITFVLSHFAQAYFSRAAAADCRSARRAARAAANIGTQLARECGNRPLDIDSSPFYLLGSEEVGELLQNIVSDHGHPRLGPSEFFRTSFHNDALSQLHQPFSIKVLGYPMAQDSGKEVPGDNDAFLENKMAAKKIPTIDSCVDHVCPMHRLPI